MVRRVELTDEVWEQIALLLPQGGWCGGRWHDHRTVVNGTLWKLKTVGTLARLSRTLRPVAETCY